jgi:enoyl-[acyl-carrier protein] reductase II
MVCETVQIPVIAAGGIGSGRAMAAALCLGAEGVQVGSRFAASLESSAHDAFKQAIVAAGDGDTKLTLKELTPVRLLRNGFSQQVEAAYARGASKEELSELLGRGRAKKGMFEGDMEEGELEIGQVSAIIRDIRPAGELLQEMAQECRSVLDRLGKA